MQQGYLSEAFVSFQGEGLFVGQRHLFVRFSGCNLRCEYCDTPGSLERETRYLVHDASDGTLERRNPISTADLSGLVNSFLQRDTAIEALALTGGEPLLQSAFLRSWLDEADLTVPVLLETNGMLPDALGTVLERIDIVSMDIKLPSNTKEPEFWSQHLRFARLAALKTLYVKVLVDTATNPEEFARATAILAEIDANIPMFIQPITDATGRTSADSECLANFHASARRSLRKVRVVPQVHKLLGIR